MILNRFEPHTDTGNIGTKPLWSHATEKDISLYKHCLDLHLKAIKVCTSLYCTNIKCTDHNHRSELEQFNAHVILSCINATLDAIPRSTTHTTRRNTISDIAREKSLFWHSLWTINGKPGVGVLADGMRYERNKHHSLVRKLKTDINSAIELSLGVALTTNQSRDY